MEDIKRIVSVLTSLIRTHNKRISAYAGLARVTSSEEIKKLCGRSIDLSNRLIRNLSTWRSAYGDFAKAGDSYSNTDTWYQLRLILSFNPEKTNINRCEELEWEILDLYKTAMPLMPSAAVEDLESQTKAVRQVMMEILDIRERKQVVGSLVTK